MYAALDIFFLLFHASLIAFILTGWIWTSTRRLHLFVMCLTFSSWFGLGLFYGVGYCPSTDWHWHIKEARGETGLPNSYVKYYLDHLTGSAWDPRLIEITVLVIALASFGLSISLQWRMWRRRGSAEGRFEDNGIQG